VHTPHQRVVDQLTGGGQVSVGDWNGATVSQPL